MEARRPGSSSATANDHVHQEEILERIEGALLAIERGSGAEWEANLHQIYRLLALFVADNLQYMEAEERDNNLTLWSLYTDEERHSIHGELLKSIEPEKM